MRYDDLIRARQLLGSFDEWRGQGVSGFTGTMAAALAANSTVGFARYNVGPTDPPFNVEGMHLHFVCLAGFTTAVVAGRRLSLRRGTGLSASTPWGGTVLDVMRDNSADASENLLDGAIATTTGLTMTGNTYETATRRRLLLSHCGNAGQDYDEIWKLDLMLRPGQLLGIVAPQAFDAGGTWQLNWTVWGTAVRF